MSTVKKKPLEPRLKRFADEFLKCMDKTEAARKAGYPAKSASQRGYEAYRHPAVKEYIEKRLEEMGMSAAEITRRFIDIATTDLRDYFVVRKVTHTPKEEISLKEFINRFKESIEFEKQFAEKAKLTKEEMDLHQVNMKSMNQQLIRLELELKSNPKAKRIVDLPEVLIDTCELDLALLKEDKTRGKIKSIANTPYGIKVEAYPADAALQNLGRIAGIFAKDNEQKTPETQSPYNDEQVDKIINAIRDKNNKTS